MGLPGAGKSTIGRRLADRLGLSFVDSDAAVERRAGRSIPAIFAADGETAFRTLEAAEIASILAGPEDVVLATGGGAVLNRGTRAHLQSRALCVYLRAEPAAIARRLRNDGSRPLLQHGNRTRQLESLLTAREPYYQAVAHLVVDVHRKPASGVVDFIAQSYAERCPASSIPHV